MNMFDAPHPYGWTMGLPRIDGLERLHTRPIDHLVHHGPLTDELAKALGFPEILIDDRGEIVKVYGLFRHPRTHSITVIVRGTDEFQKDVHYTGLATEEFLTAFRQWHQRLYRVAVVILELDDCTIRGVLDQTPHDEHEAFLRSIACQATTTQEQKFRLQALTIVKRYGHDALSFTV